MARGHCRTCPRLPARPLKTCRVIGMILLIKAIKRVAITLPGAVLTAIGRLLVVMVKLTRTPMLIIWLVRMTMLMFLFVVYLWQWDKQEQCQAQGMRTACGKHRNNISPFIFRMWQRKSVCAATAIIVFIQHDASSSFV